MPLGRSAGLVDGSDLLDVVPGTEIGHDIGVLGRAAVRVPHLPHPARRGITIPRWWMVGSTFPGREAAGAVALAVVAFAQPGEVVRDRAAGVVGGLVAGVLAEPGDVEPDWLA